MPEERKGTPRKPQAPSARSSEKKPAPKPVPKKKAPSPEEIARRNEKRREAARLAREREKAAQEEAARRAKLRRGRRRMLFLAAGLVSVVFVVLYWCWVALDLALRPDGNEEALPILIFQKDAREEDARFEVKDCVFDGVSYLPVSCLEPYLEISEFGDYETRSFLLRESGEYATFYLDTCNVVINGENVSMKYKSFVKDNVLYLPLDFYSLKLNCFEYTHSAALGASVLTFDPEVTPSFCFSQQQDQKAVDPATVPVPPEPEPQPETGETPTE